MGVTNLWQILEPVKEHCALSSLSGQTLAVDLSIWICETQCVKQMQGVVSKPFLRNLFFRISHLLQLGVHLVFVVEGEAPELKWEAMFKRQQTRFPGRGRGQGHYRGGAGKHSRRNFNSCIRECCEMLDYLGIPYLQSKGEAEAMCAALDAARLVDGCLTNDGDAFLYGARTVYRNFTMSSQDPHVESYKMTDVKNKLGFQREHLVAMALFLGCDYLPKGVPGVGIDKAVKLMSCLQGASLFDRLKKWKGMSESECLDQIEVIVRRKAITVADFPQCKVVEEFMTTKDRCPTKIQNWRRPSISKLQDFSLDKLEWPIEYTLEKVLPLVTLWDMTDISRNGHSSGTRIHLKPLSIVKSRVRQGVPCYEIHWEKRVTDSCEENDFYTTIESQELFVKCYPNLVKEFEEITAAKKAKGKRKKRNVDAAEDGKILQEKKDAKPCEVEALSDSLSNINISLLRETTLTNKERQVNGNLETQQHKIMKETTTTAVMSELRDNSQEKCYERSLPKLDSKPVLNVKPMVFVNLGKQATSGSEMEVKCGNSRQDVKISAVQNEDSEEDSDDDCDLYIPLSQRIKMNFQKESNEEQGSHLLSSFIHDTGTVSTNKKVSAQLKIESLKKLETVTKCFVGSHLPQGERNADTVDRTHSQQMSSFESSENIAVVTTAKKLAKISKFELSSSKEVQTKKSAEDLDFEPSRNAPTIVDISMLEKNTTCCLQEQLSCVTKTNNSNPDSEFMQTANIRMVTNKPQLQNVNPEHTVKVTAAHTAKTLPTSNLNMADKQTCSPNHGSGADSNRTDSVGIDSFDFTILTPSTTRVMRYTTPPISKDSNSRIIGMLNNSDKPMQSEMLIESTPQSQNRVFLSQLFSKCMSSPLQESVYISPTVRITDTPTDGPMKRSGTILDDSVKLFDVVNGTISNLSLHTSLDHYGNEDFEGDRSVVNQSMNQTSDSVASYGDFNVESSLLKSMVLRHQSLVETPERSDLHVQPTGNFQMESSLLKSLLRQHGKSLSETPGNLELDPIFETSESLSKDNIDDSETSDRQVKETRDSQSPKDWNSLNSSQTEMLLPKSCDPEQEMVSFTADLAGCDGDQNGNKIMETHQRSCSSNQNSVIIIDDSDDDSNDDLRSIPKRSKDHVVGVKNRDSKKENISCHETKPVLQDLQPEMVEIVSVHHKTKQVLQDVHPRTDETVSVYPKTKAVLQDLQPGKDETLSVCNKPKAVLQDSLPVNDETLSVCNKPKAVLQDSVAEKNKTVNVHVCNERDAHSNYVSIPAVKEQKKLNNDSSHVTSIIKNVSQKHKQTANKILNVKAVQPEIKVMSCSDNVNNVDGKNVTLENRPSHSQMDCNSISNRKLTVPQSINTSDICDKDYLAPPNILNERRSHDTGIVETDKIKELKVCSSAAVIEDKSPVALADRLRAKLRKGSCRSALGDITGNQNYANDTIL